MGRVAGKVALVTGAASRIGIGFAIAGALAREGARVVLTDIAENAVAERAAELRAAGLDAVAHGHDVTDEAGWREVLDCVTAARSTSWLTTPASQFWCPSSSSAPQISGAKSR